MFPLYIMLLLVFVMVGLILLIAGVIVLFKVKNKLAGLVVGTVGLVFTLIPFAAFLYLITTRSLG